MLPDADNKWPTAAAALARRIARLVGRTIGLALGPRQTRLHRGSITTHRTGAKLILVVVGVVE